MDFTGLPAVFDCHIHIPDGRNMEWAPAIADMPALLAYLRRVHVGGAVLSSTRALLTKSPAEMVEANHALVEICRAAGPGFTAGLTVNGNWVDESLQLMREWRGQGLCWVGECCGYIAGYGYETPGWRRLMEEAASLDMILQVHCSSQEMDAMAAAFPKTTFVLPHFPDRAGLADLIDMLRRRANVYFDICGSQYVRMGFLEAVVKAVGAHRVMAGSDLTICDPATVIARVIFAQIDDAQKRQILAGTAVELLARHGTTVGPDVL